MKPGMKKGGPRKGAARCVFVVADRYAEALHRRFQGFRYQGTKAGRKPKDATESDRA